MNVCPPPPPSVHTNPFSQNSRASVTELQIYATVLDMLRTLRAGSAASGAKASSFNLGAAIAASLTWDSHFAQVPGLLAARLISSNVTHAAISAEAPMPCSRDFNELVRGM